MKILYLYNTASNNPGNKALYNGCLELLKSRFPRHEAFEFDLDLLAYRKIKEIDFVNYVNSFDLAVVAGLIIFNGQTHYDRTGSKFDISLSLLDKIKPRVIFLGVSTRIWKDKEYHHKGALQEFIQYIEMREGWELVLRDDGSDVILSNLLGSRINPKKLIDPALFAFKPREEAKRDSLYIALNNEDAQNRYTSDYELFKKTICLAIDKVLSKNLYSCVVLQPHGVDDSSLLGEIIQGVSPYFKNRMIEMGRLSCRKPMSVYDQYRLDAKHVWSMRIHSMNPALAMHIPTFCITSSRRIEEFCQSFMIKECMCRFNDASLISKLLEFSQDAFNQATCFERIDRRKRQSISELADWLT